MTILSCIRFGRLKALSLTRRVLAMLMLIGTCLSTSTGFADQNLMAPYADPQVSVWSLNEKRPAQDVKPGEPEDETLRLASGNMEEAQAVRAAMQSIQRIAENPGGGNIVVVVMDPNSVKTLVQFTHSLKLANPNETYIQILHFDVVGQETAQFVIGKRRPAEEAKGSGDKKQVASPSNPDSSPATVSSPEAPTAEISSPGASTAETSTNSEAAGAAPKSPGTPAAGSTTAEAPKGNVAKRAFFSVLNSQRWMLDLLSYYKYSMKDNLFSTVFTAGSFFLGTTIHEVLVLCKADHVGSAIGIMGAVAFTALLAINHRVPSDYAMYLNQKAQRFKIAIGARVEPAEGQSLTDETILESKNKYIRYGTRFFYSMQTKILIRGSILFFMGMAGSDFFNNGGMAMTNWEMIKYSLMQVPLVAMSWQMMNMGWEELSCFMEDIERKSKDVVPKATFWMRRITDVHNFVNAGMVTAVAMLTAPKMLAAITPQALLGALVSVPGGIITIYAISSGLIGVYALIHSEDIKEFFESKEKMQLLKKVPGHVASDAMWAAGKLASPARFIVNRISRALVATVDFVVSTSQMAPEKVEKFQRKLEGLRQDLGMAARCRFLF